MADIVLVVVGVCAFRTFPSAQSNAAHVTATATVLEKKKNEDIVYEQGKVIPSGVSCSKTVDVRIASK